ncbi:hypothetical protein BJF85_07450 [Saccharomonospora sp. CUA-673]|uniref:hypothetical protein n=1 Tax=Saccharomonospora sp. CUA-673 TaxID=1904969 RepID=UPI00095D301B|nr:hypothetical protein [Saccharomonospora sp. CUA-673]OLT39047.1 hypothetical protein BJF85_07450 [Saccharomonospora sp. CUA-673]
MSQPFAVRPEWQAEFERRWSRASTTLTVAVVGSQTVVLVTTVIALVLSRWWAAALSVLLVVPIAAYLLWFVLSSRYLTHPQRKWWMLRVAGLGALQPYGVVFPVVLSAFQGREPAWVLVVIAVVAVVAASLATWSAHGMLYGSPAGDPTSPADPIALAAAAPGLLLEHDMRMHSTLRDCRVSMDGQALRWRLRAASGGLVRFTVGSGQLPLEHITGIRFARVDPGAEPLLDGRVPVPAGPVVVVATPYGEVPFAVRNPPLFAAQLHARLQNLGRQVPTPH